MKNGIVSIFAGALFGIGLALSGMTDTSKVIGFLDLFGAWDPTLIFVMGFGVATTFLSFKYILRSPHPLFSDRFYLPTTTDIDYRLIAGAALFGIGWGLYGYCPGPAIASLTYGETSNFIFVAALVAGSISQRVLMDRKPLA